MKARYAAPNFVALRYELAREQQRFLQTELSLAKTFAELAETHYQRRHSDRANRCKDMAEIALQTVRCFVATTDLLSTDAIDSLWQRCDELERILATVKGAK